MWCIPVGPCHLFAPSNTTKTVFVLSPELLQEFCFLIHETAVTNACVHFYRYVGIGKIITS